MIRKLAPEHPNAGGVGRWAVWGVMWYMCNGKFRLYSLTMTRPAVALQQNWLFYTNTRTHIHTDDVIPVTIRWWQCTKKLSNALKRHWRPKEDLFKRMTFLGLTNSPSSPPWQWDLGVDCLAEQWECIFDRFILPYVPPRTNLLQILHKIHYKNTKLAKI